MNLQISKKHTIDKKNHFRAEIWYKRKNQKLPRGLNQIIVDVFRTFNGMSHEITYTGPLNPLIYMVLVYLTRLYVHTRTNEIVSRFL